MHDRFVADHKTFVDWAETLDWPTFEMHLVVWLHMAFHNGAKGDHDATDGGPAP